jgi:hypothetical protein
MNKLTLSIAAAFIAGSVTLSPGAGAQTPPAKPTGTADQLRACLGMQDDIEARQKTLKEAGEKLTKTTDSLNEQGKDLAEEGQRVSEDPSASGSGRRARFERKERAFRQEREAHMASQEKFNADRKKIEDDFTAFRQKCADTAYLQDDIEKVKKEREAAGKK